MPLQDRYYAFLGSVIHFYDRPWFRRRNDQLLSFRIHNHRRYRRWWFFPWRRVGAGWILFGHRLRFGRRYHRVVDVGIGGFSRERIVHCSACGGTWRESCLSWLTAVGGFGADFISPLTGVAEQQKTTEVLGFVVFLSCLKGRRLHSQISIKYPKSISHAGCPPRIPQFSASCSFSKINTD